MQTLRMLLVLTLVMAMAIPSPSLAQERHVLDRSALTHTVTEQVAREDAERATIHDVLDRPEVRSVAAQAGIDLGRVNATVDTLDGTSLSQVASAAHEVSETLVGGASVTITTTTIIIALLVIILIIVAVD